MNPLDFPSYLFGLRVVGDPARGRLGAEKFLLDAGKPGWLALTLNLSLRDSSQSHALTSQLDFSSLADDGFSLIVELNQAEGKFPDAAQYDVFASECAELVAQSRGAKIWVIGSETNRANVAPAAYAECFAKCRAAIKKVPEHHDDWIVPAPPASDETAADRGDWVKYFQDVLFQCAQRDARPDALALHIHTRGAGTNLIANDEKSTAFPNRHAHFRAYRDFLGAVLPALRHLPVLITAASPNEWHNTSAGWIQNAYAEINAWNSVSTHQAIQALCVGQDWRPAWQDDLRAALQNEYRVRWHKVEVPPDYRIEWRGALTIPENKMAVDATLPARVELKNTGARTWLASNAPRAQLSLRWFDSHNLEVKLPAFVPFPRSVAPGKSLLLEVPLRAPGAVGTYLLRLDVQVEGVGGLSALGSPAPVGSSAQELSVRIVPPDYAVEWLEAVEIPNTTIPANERARGNVRVKNIGALDWLRGGTNPVRLTYAWVEAQTATVSERGEAFALVADTPAGRTAMFENVSVRAPKSAGAYTLRWDLIHEGVTPFSAQGAKTHDAQVEVTRPIPDWAARWLRTFATTQLVLEPNETINGEVVVENVGTQTWKPDAVKLVYRWIADDGQETSGINYEAQSFALASDVTRDAQTTFALVTVRAPIQRGHYLLRFDLRRDGEWFSAGESATADIDVKVQSSAPDYLACWETVPTLPQTCIANSLLEVRAVVKNIGASPWPSHGANAVHLHYQWFDESYTPLSLAEERESLSVEHPVGEVKGGVQVDVLPREAVEFSRIEVRVPQEPGEYTLTWDLYRVTDEAFGALGSPTPTTRVTVRPEPRDYQAQFSAHDTPAQLPVNAEVNVNLRARNIGNKNWQAFARLTTPLARRTEDKRVALGYKWIDSEGNVVGLVKNWLTSLTREVKPEEELVVRARLATPPLPGLYELRWDFLVGEEEFGAPLTQNARITEQETPASFWRAEASQHAENGQRAIDGDVSTAWSSVAPQDTGMWFRVHFNSPHVMDALAFRSPGRGHPFGFELKISADGEAWQSVMKIESGNTRDVLATFNPQPVLVTQIDLLAPSPQHLPWTISEIAMHASPLWSATASVNGEFALRAVQNGAGFWSTKGAQKSETWFQLNLGRVELVSALQLLPPRDENPRGCIVSAWNEDTHAWQRLAEVHDNDAPLDVTFAPLHTKYLSVQLTQDAPRVWAIREVRVDKALGEWVK